MVLAMAQYQLGQTNEARTALAEGVRLAGVRASWLKKGDLSSFWYSDMRDQAMINEAKALIQGK